ncbi:MAG: hypothetical protein RIQ81_1515 [Pseudomonadota bacterium]
MVIVADFLLALRLSSDPSQASGLAMVPAAREQEEFMRGLFPRPKAIVQIASWTAGGAAFGVLFGALASIFQGGPEMSRGIQETWWWFAVAGFLAATIGTKSRNGDRSQSAP